MKQVNVYTKIVKKDMCSGCGICAGIYDECLTMAWNRYGEYVPCLKRCSSCGRCLTVCPFYQLEEPIQRLEIENSKYDYFAGYTFDNNQRKLSSSGGIVSHLMKALLLNKAVDFIVTVKNSNEKDKFFEPVIISNPEDILHCSASKYYPVEFSTIIQKLKHVSGKFAFVALPCVINALNKASECNPWLKDKIKYKIGLACGHNKSKFYAEALILFNKVNIDDVEKINFRFKPDGLNNAKAFKFLIEFKNGSKKDSFKFTDAKTQMMWGRRFFALNACFLCNDFFAKNADITAMDAWLPEYFKSDPFGTTFLIIRNQNIKNLLLEEKIKAKINLMPIPYKKIVVSQKGDIIFRQKFVTFNVLKLIKKEGIVLKTKNKKILKLYEKVYLNWLKFNMIFSKFLFSRKKYLILFYRKVFFVYFRLVLFTNEFIERIIA